MGQQEVLKILEGIDGKEKVSAKQIAELTDIGSGSVTMSLKKLRRSELVNWDKLFVNGRKRYFYWCL